MGAGAGVDESAAEDAELAEANQIIAFLAGDGLSLSGKRVADIGCGDGMIDLHLALATHPDQLVGYDVRPTRTLHLYEHIRLRRAASELPKALRFVTSTATHIPARSASFDVVIAVATLEFIDSGPAVCREIARILKPNGLLVVRLSPYVASAPYPRTNLDAVQRNLASAGLRIAKVDAETPLINVDAEHQYRPLSTIGLGRVSLLVAPSTRVIYRPVSRVIRGAARRARDRYWRPRKLRQRTVGTGAQSDFREEGRWFTEHYREAATTVIDFLRAGGVVVQGTRVADVGCGDGIIDLGILDGGRPAELWGYDLRLTDVSVLLERAERAGVGGHVRTGLHFAESSPTSIPTPDGSFDVVVSWSAFEHVEHPVTMAREVYRVLRPGGVFMLQLWPFYLSPHGAHMVDWFPEGFAHLNRPLDELRAEVIRRSPPNDPTAESVVTAYLSKITPSDLQRSLLASGLVITQLQLMVSGLHIPREVDNCRISDLLIGGVKLLAVRSG